LDHPFEGYIALAKSSLSGGIRSRGGIEGSPAKFGYFYTPKQLITTYEIQTPAGMAILQCL
jgi:hypothetical protein